MSAAATKSRRSILPPFAVAFVVVAGLVTTVALVVPRFPVSDRGPTCMNNISQLGQMFVIARQEKRFDPTLHGSAQIFSWTRSLRAGDERIFVCPGDQSVCLPETPEEARRWHPRDPRSVEHGLTSYAVRDFEKYPLDEHASEKEIILCDRLGENGRTMHHKGVLVVCYATGDAQKLSREELGFAPDEQIVVGPDSPNPELRKMERP